MHTAPGDGPRRLASGLKAHADDIAVVTAFVILTAVMTYPLSLSPGTRVLTIDADTNLFLWTLAWDLHALLHQPLSIFEANIFFPEHHSLAFSENLFGVALLVAPWLAAGKQLLAMNAASLLSCVLSGVGAYLLGRQLRLSMSGALVAGIIFAFAAPRFYRFSQLHLTSVQWIPFCLTFAHRYLESGQRRHVLAAIAFFTAQVLSSGHGALFLTMSLCGLLLYEAALSSGVAWRKLARDIGIGGLALLAINVPFVVPYYELRRTAGFERSIQSAEHWSPTAVSYVASPSHVHRALSARIIGSAGMRRANAYLFPGYLTLILPLIWLVKTRDAGTRTATPTSEGPGVRMMLRRRREQLQRRLCARGSPALGFYAALAVLTLWASAGPRLGLYRLLYDYVPGFSFIRVPSRMTIVTLLCLAVLAGAGLDRLRDLVAVRRRWWVGAGVIGVLILELAVFPLKTRAYAVDIPAVERWLARQPGSFAIAEVPVGRPEHASFSRLNSVYMLHSMAHWQRTVNGYSGYLPRRSGTLFSKLTRFPDEASLRALQRLGVAYVVVHLDLYPRSERAAVEERLARWSSQLRLRQSDGTVRIYSLRGSAGSAGSLEKDRHAAGR